MKTELRKFLESLGLRAEANEQEAWEYFDQLEGQQRDRARRLQRGEAAVDNDPPAEGEQGEQVDLTVGVRTLPSEEQRIRRETLEAERRRVQAIRALADADIDEELVEMAISDGWDEARASREFLLSLRSSRGSGAGPAIHSRSREVDVTAGTVTAALMLRAGLDPVQRSVRVREGGIEPVRHSDQLEQQAEHAWRYRDISLIDLCREAIRLDGNRLPHTREETFRSAVSGGSLSNVFTNLVGAQLLATYEDSPDTTAGWVREADVANFKTQDRIQLGKEAGLEKLPRGDTAKHVNRGDAKESYKIARYAKQFVVDEQDVIDDDLQALMDMPVEMGRAAARLRPDLVYAIILSNDTLDNDGVALFDASTHNNLNTTSALSDTTLEAAITDMGTQTQDGVNLGITPYGLLVPRALKHTASKLVNSSEINTGSDITEGTRNPFLDDNLVLISDSRLDNGVTDPADGDVLSGSGTTWYLVSRGGRHTIEVGYLRGSGRRPMMRSFVLTQGQWGMGWDIKMDIGAKALDFRGLHKNTA